MVAVAACTLFFAAILAAAHAIMPYADTGYEELVSTRFYLSGAAPVYGWERLPFADPPTQAAASNVTVQAGGAPIAGFYVIGAGQAIFISGSNGQFVQHPVEFTGISLAGSVRIGVDRGTETLAIVATPSAVYHVQCEFTGSAVVCTTLFSIAADLQLVTDVAVVPESNGVAYIACSTGGYLFEAPNKAIHLLQTEVPTAVAYFAPRQLAAFGGNESVTTYIKNVLVRRDWVTDVVNGYGGVYDGPVTSLAFDELGWLFVGNVADVNILFPNSTVNHLSRFQGLPYNVTTSVSVERNTRKCSLGMYGCFRFHLCLFNCFRKPVGGNHAGCGALEPR